MSRPPNAWLTLLALLLPMAFLIALRLLTSDDLEGVTFDAEPLITTPTEREVRDQQRVNVALAGFHVVLRAGDAYVNAG